MINIVKDYATKKLDLLKLEATEKTSVGLGNLVSTLLIVVMALFFVIFFNIGIGLWIGHSLGHYGYGLLIVAGFYLLLTIIFVLTKKSIANSIANKIVEQILK
ncbi:MAG: phage holin family protein [Bergeyella zoohelcum]|nr:phage holin family protein [Bergeyella zoohelcum]